MSEYVISTPHIFKTIPFKFCLVLSKKLVIYFIRTHKHASTSEWQLGCHLMGGACRVSLPFLSLWVVVFTVTGLAVANNFGGILGRYLIITNLPLFRSTLMLTAQAMYDLLAANTISALCRREVSLTALSPKQIVT